MSNYTLKIVNPGNATQYIETITSPHSPKLNDILKLTDGQLVKITDKTEDEHEDRVYIVRVEVV